MARKFYCDNCGKEVDESKLFEVNAYCTADSDDFRELGEFCEECTNKLNKIIDEGFS